MSIQDAMAHLEAKKYKKASEENVSKPLCYLRNQPLNEGILPSGVGYLVYGQDPQ